MGELIAFWGFKKGHGQIWTLLFLRDTELTAKEIQDAFSLSKGGVSQLLKDLEEWRVVKRQKMHGKRAMVFVANTNLLEMIALVFQKRELMVLEKVILSLKAVENALELRPAASKVTLQRVSRMRKSGRECFACHPYIPTYGEARLKPIAATPLNPFFVSVGRCAFAITVSNQLCSAS